MTSLQTNKLDHLCPEADGWPHESGFVRVDGRALPNEVGLVGLDNLCALYELPDDEVDGS